MQITINITNPLDPNIYILIHHQLLTSRFKHAVAEHLHLGPQASSALRHLHRFPLHWVLVHLQLKIPAFFWPTVFNGYSLRKYVRRETCK